MNVGLYGNASPDDTGPSRVTRGLADGLARLDHEVTVYSPTDEVEESPAYRSVSVVESPSSVSDYIKAQFVAAGNSGRHDLFHALQDFTPPADVKTVQWVNTWAEMWLSRTKKTGRPLRSVLGKVVVDEMSGIGSWRSGRLVATSRVTADQMRRWWMKRPDHIHPLGVDYERYREPDHSDEGALCVGRICPKKGQLGMLEATRESVILAGGIGDESYYSSLPANHNHLGFVEREKLIDIYDSARIVAIPSQHENFSMVALEALASGCLVVATESCGFTGFDWANRSNGIWVESDAHGVGRRLDELVGQDHYKKRVAGWELAETLDWKHIAEWYEGIYND